MRSVEQGFMFSLEDQINNYMISPDELRQMQQKNAGNIEQMNSLQEGGWVVSFPNGAKMQFENQAEAIDWAQKNFGSLKMPAGSEGNQYMWKSEIPDDYEEKYNEKHG